MSELVPVPKRELRNGRRTKCTPEVIQIVCDAIREGMSLTGSMRLAGVSPNVLFGVTGWVHQGELGVAPYSDFVQQVMTAQGEAERAAVRALVKGWKTDWRAAVSYLARIHKAEWSERQEIEMPTGPGADVQAQVRAELEAVRLALRDGSDSGR
jgi:hypothetical protein